MRVAHFCTQFSRLSETFVYDVVLGLESAGVENHVLTTSRINPEERPFERVHLLPIPLWRQATFVVRRRCFNVYRLPLPARSVRKTLRDIKPDVILAHFGGAGAAIAPFAHELDIPLAVVFHAFDLFTKPFNAAMYARLWASETRAIAVSEHGRARLIELGCPPERCQVIHCGVDVERFSLPPRAQPDRDALHIVSIGRLVEKKGFDDLLRAVALIRTKLDGPVRLDIWGAGPLARSLNELIDKLDLRDVATLMGVIERQAVPTILRHYDIFVQPSRTARNGDVEGIPITILEAQAASLPVVGTSHAGIPEAIPPANREWLVGEGEVEALARKLLYLATRPHRREEMGRAGRDWVLEHFSLNDEIASYARVLRDTHELSSAQARGS